jgi:hypothetical protein
MTDKLPILQTTVDMATDFMKDSVHVIMDEQQIEKLSEDMKKSGLSRFDSAVDFNLSHGIQLELLAGSINYCYWYGKSDMRVCGASATLMYDLLTQSYEMMRGLISGAMVSCFLSLLANKRFPLLEEREKHLRETLQHVDKVGLVIETQSLADSMKAVIEKIPGYASDMFLKRACLLFMQLNRKYGLFSGEMDRLIVPADYQVPKMLRHFGCIHYRQELSNKVKNQELIPKWSRMECEIRAATVLVCEDLCELTGWNLMDIDSWLWLRRKDAEEPFHLTVTTDY